MNRKSLLARRPPRHLSAVWIVKLAAVSMFLVAGLAGLAGCGPLGPIPGGALSGPVGAAEIDDWSFAAGVENAQLETRLDDPHSVNTWFASVGSNLYVPTSMIRGSKTPTKRSWVAHVDEDDRVRIRLGDTVFERRVRRIADGSDEYNAARAALEARYEIEPEDRDPERVIWIFRVEARAD